MEVLKRNVDYKKSTKCAMPTSNRILITCFGAQNGKSLSSYKKNKRIKCRLLKIMKCRINSYDREIYCIIITRLIKTILLLKGDPDGCDDIVVHTYLYQSVLIMTNV